MRSPADACTGQRTVGPWHLRLPHFRPDRTPASGDELQTEYFVPWEHTPAAIATVTALGTHIRPVLLLTEEALAPHGARPHWGKLFTYPREYLEQVYGASMQRFRDAAGALDPGGRFRNDFLDRWVFDGWSYRTGDPPVRTCARSGRHTRQSRRWREAGTRRRPFTVRSDRGAISPATSQYSPKVSIPGTALQGQCRMVPRGLM